MKEENIKGEYQRKVDKSLIPTCNIMGVNIAAINMNWLLKYLDENLSDIKGDYICVSNVHTTVTSYENTDATVTIATSKSQVSAIHNQLGENVGISVEPCRRDTFPAIALAAAYLKDVQHVGEEEAVVICPVENIIMFIPFGLLAPMVFKRMRKVRFCVFIGFLCSCGIELSQLITQRGYCQLDDVVTNTVGMLVGWGIWKMLSSVGIAKNPLF